MNFTKKYMGAKKDPVEFFAQLAYLMKILSFLAIGVYSYSLGSYEFSNMTSTRCLLALALFGVGQFLNMSVYKAIGVNGVYYGTRLGKKVPWYNGFPFGTVPHPQYLGSALSYWGVFLFFYNASHHLPLMALGVFTTLFYAFSSYVEQVY